MILKNIKTEYVDKRTGFVLKRIRTSEWQHNNRKLAVNNSLLNCELSRESVNKSILESPFEIHHIRFDKKLDDWDFDAMNLSKKHASKHNRFFLTFQQRTDETWDNLSWHETENDYQEMASRGLPLVPYHIPITGELDDWKSRKEDALSILNKSQMLVPILSSKHDHDKFQSIFSKEFIESKLIGTQCYSVNNANTQLNLNKVKVINMSVKEGEDCPLLLMLNHAKRINSLFNVSGSFAYSCYGGDIFSDRQTFLENMPPEVVKQILGKNPDEIYKYDRSEGKFNLPEEQLYLRNVNSTNAFLQSIDLSNNLTAYQAIQWANHFNQQEDFKELNQKLLETATEPNILIDYIRTAKNGWVSFWNRKIETTV